MRKKFFLPHSLVCVVALLVLLGSLYQFSVKQEFATYWHEQKSMLEQIRSLCPALSDDTFVVILDRSGQPDLSHDEVSAYLIVLYDNLSIMGNTISFLRFHLDGIDSTFYNTPVRWSPPHVIGPLTETPFRLKPTPPLARIAYDRILLLEFDGKTVRLVPSIEVKTQEGTPLEVKSNPIRILPQSVGKTLVWRHLAS